LALHELRFEFEVPSEHVGELHHFTDDLDREGWFRVSDVRGDIVHIWTRDHTVVNSLHSGPPFGSKGATEQDAARLPVGRQHGAE
jgi:predicted NUDIX family NTP pyrophosphohydrolase